MNDRHERRRQHINWLGLHGDELSALGLPLRVFETADRWADFLDNGHLHWHEDAGSFSFEDLGAGRRAGLHRFLEQEAVRVERVAPLLSWLRVRSVQDTRCAQVAVPATADHAIEWLRVRGAHAWLVRHHELVLEAATQIVDGLERGLGLEFDGDSVLLGAALHDAGKMEHPSEMHAPGHAHELSGKVLLLREGFPVQIARVCVTHADWSGPGATLEDRLVALSDKLWKGKRDGELEERLLDELGAHVGRAAWEVFDVFDTLCEYVAAEGASRLRRSHVDG